MTLRARLLPALAAILLGPVLAGSLAIGVVVPRVAGNANAAVAGRNADAAAAALAGACAAVGDIGQAAARELSASLAAGVPLPKAAADAVARAVARPDSRAGGVDVVVLDAGDRVLAGVGAGTSRPAAAAAGRSSCAQATPAPAGPPVLSSVTPVTIESVRRARLVAWRTLDDAALGSLASTLELSGGLTLLSGAPGNDGPPPRRLAGTGPAAAFGPVADQLALGRTSGRAGLSRGAVRFTVRHASVGLPYPLVATTPDRGASLLPWLVGLLGLALALGVLVVRVVAGPLVEPLAFVGPIRSRPRKSGAPRGTGRRPHPDTGRLRLPDGYERLGEALGRTHDLDGLLETVAGAAADEGGALTGVVLLADPVAIGDPVPIGEVTGLAERYRLPLCAEPGTDPGTADPEQAPAQDAQDPAAVQAVADSLADFAVVATRAAAAGAAPLSVGTLPEAGPVVVLPLRSGDRVLGALALARGPGGAPFEPDAVHRLDVLARQAGTAIANARLHEETRRLSVTDPLTGTGNVRHLSTTLSREVERATRFNRPLTVLMLDLDKFKDVNDAFGHAVGDAVLRECAQRLTNCVREVDTVARYGGEEFTVVLPETDAEGGRKAAERILLVIRDEDFRIGELPVSITVSIGIASFPAHGRTATELLRSADSALYAAKAAGRDRYVVAAVSTAAAAAQHAG